MVHWDLRRMPRVRVNSHWSVCTFRSDHHFFLSVEFFRSDSSLQFLLAAISSSAAALCHLCSFVMIIFKSHSQALEFAADSEIFATDSQISVNSEILFQNDLNIETTDQHILNQYVRYRLDQYAALNVENYELWICIQIDFEKFTQTHFAQLSESIWLDLLIYCYSHEYWIDDDTVKNLSVNMMKILNPEFDYNDQWSLNQINWMKTTYNTLFGKQQRRKRELTVNQSAPDSVNQSGYDSVNVSIISDSVNQSAYVSANQHSYVSAIQFTHVSVNQSACISVKPFSSDSVIRFPRVLVNQSSITSVNQSSIASIIQSAIVSVIQSAITSIIESAIVSVIQQAIASVIESAIVSVIQQAVVSVIESAIASVIQSVSASISQSLYADQPQNQSQNQSSYNHQFENQSSQSPLANLVNQSSQQILLIIEQTIPKQAISKQATSHSAKQAISHLIDQASSQASPQASSPAPDQATPKKAIPLINQNVISTLIQQANLINQANSIKHVSSISINQTILIKHAISKHAISINQSSIVSASYFSSVSIIQSINIRSVIQHLIACFVVISSTLSASGIG